MTLTTHAVAGALIGAIASQNLAFVAVAAFASHFLLDSIPHWDYALASSERDSDNPLKDDIKASGKTFFIDLSKIAFDAILGVAIAVVLFYSGPTTVLIGAVVGAIFAILPDPLQFAYMKIRREPLISLQKFHLFMHADADLNDKPFLGVGFQVALIVIFALVSRLLI
jgi:hypothetical protein